MKALFNISFTLPEPPSNYSGERRADYIAQRNFYNLTADYNYFNYSLNGSKVVKNANAEHYFTREGSNTGLFDMEGPISEEKKAQIKEQLKSTKSTIWHGFISFDEVTSLGFTNQESCIKFMRQTFGAFLENAGFKKSNIQLYCSLHDDTQHRHIHFAFYEKAPIHLDKNGEPQFTRRGKVRSEAIDNYLVSANMHLSEHGAEYYSSRDAAIAEMQRIRDVKSRSGFIDGSASTASLTANIAINALCSKLSASGRLQYNSEDMRALRPDIDKVADIIIRSDPYAFAAHTKMLKELARVKGEVVELVQSGKLGYVNGVRMTSADIAAAMGDGPTLNRDMQISLVDLDKITYYKKLEADYKARIGNIVLSMCKEIKRNERASNGKRYLTVNNKHRKIEARRRRGFRKDLLLQAQRAINAVCYMESANFLKSVKEHERDIQEEKFQSQQ